MMLAGECLCGAVRFEVEDAFKYAAYCHCSRCRRRSGSAFNAFAGIEIDKLRFISGQDLLLRQGENDDGYDALCGVCHSPLFAAVRGRQYVHVLLGSLTNAPTKQPDHHIYVGSKAPWHTITDNLPQFVELPD